MTSRKIRGAAPTYTDLRMTIPARELLEQLGNEIRIHTTDSGPRYSVTLTGQLAAKGVLVLVLIGQGNEQHRGLRLIDEPAYPGEWANGVGIAWHERGDWVRCPRCGHALVWYEAGYVPGYRLCTRGHHAQLSSDGKSAAKAG